jgi:drug/metabolite transporter (DMT)-like permease
MITAGVAWGAYSLLGRGAARPAAVTAWNFARAAPLALLPLWFVRATGALHITATGAALACVSGALTSGVGYIAWYAVLPRLSVTTAAIAQLSVPALAAVAAVALLGEPATMRLAASGALILGGIAIAVVARAKKAR